MLFELLFFKDLKTSVRNLNNELDRGLSSDRTILRPLIGYLRASLSPTSSFSVQLTRAAELRFSSVEMDDRTVTAGSSIELKCEVYSVPPPIFTW